MAITQLTDVVVPQVIADLAREILFAKTLLINSPYVGDGSAQVYRDGGNTLTFPKWTTSQTGLVQDQVDTRTGVTPSKITMDSYTESVVDKIISFDVNKHVLQDILASASPEMHIAELVAQQVQVEIQQSLIAKALGTGTAYDAYSLGSGNTLSVDAILAAKMQWGEHAAGQTPGLFVHSKQFTDLAGTSDFKNLGTATLNNPIVNAAAGQGAVAIVHGVLIYLLDSITVKSGTVSSITRSSSTATLTTAAAHNFVAGDKIVISGCDQAEYNGTFTILTVPTTTTMTFAVSGTPATPATGSPAITSRYESLLMLPDALWLVFKQNLEATSHRHAGSPILTNDFDFRYCTTRRRVLPERVVKFSTR